MSLRTRLVLLFGLGIVVVAGILGITFEQFAARSIRSNSEKQLASAAFQMQDKLDRGMFERYRDIQIAATLSDVFHVDQPIDRQRIWLNKLTEAYPSYAWIGFAAPGGQVISATRGILEGADVSQRPWFKGALETSFASDVHEALLLQKYLLPGTKEPLRFVDVSSPVRGPQGELQGILGAHLNWTWANEVERSILSTSGIPDAEIVIVSKKGLVLLGPDSLIQTQLPVPPDLLGSGDVAAVAAVLAMEGKYLTSASLSRGHLDYEGLGWIVVARQPLKTALAPLGELRRFVAFLTIGVAVLFIGVGWAAAYWIAKPLEVLTRASDRIKDGFLSGQIPQVKGYREVKSLSRSMAAAVETMQRQDESLRELNASLEQRVADRTAELEAARGKLENQKGQLRTIVDNVSEGLMILDTRGRITPINYSLQTLFGMDDAELKRADLSSLLHPGDRDTPDLYGAALLALDRRETDNVIVSGWHGIGQRADGEVFQAEVVAAAILFDDEPATLLSIHDVSHRHEMELLKDEFIATVSHELRTPLTAIHGALGLLRAQPEMGSGKPGTLLAIAHRNSDRLLSLVNDILDLAKLDAGKMEFHNVPLQASTILREAAENMATYSGEHGVSIAVAPVEEGFWLHADPQRLHQVLANLLSNAVKFSPKGGFVSLRALRTEDSLRIEIEDWGPGIAPEFQDKMFQKFVQSAQPHAIAQKSTGLGLVITKAIIERLGGTIGYESAPGRTVFHIAWPASHIDLVEPSFALAG